MRYASRVLERRRLDADDIHVDFGLAHPTFSQGERIMNIALWIVQVLLAAAFAAHGLMFLAPPPEIAAQMNATLPRWFQIFLGVAEVMAAAGLTLPGLTRIAPKLIVWAAGGLMIVMVSATALHAVRGEFSSAATTLVLLVLATFVAYGRQRRPIQPRGGLQVPAAIA
jgi:putative oxidoreductase